MSYNNKIKGSIEDITKNEIIIINDIDGEKIFLNKNLFNTVSVEKLEVGHIVDIEINCSINILENETIKRKKDVVDLQNDLFQ